ncbi:putative transposase-like DNA-binding protein [Kribbella sp. VKM Ac-2527]|uniref:Putative transposase-like DNA-binding protein n=1 Tax=Kribbella caucasensis TaxID=2512215 RepID=A0A4R6JFJ7_9ACTN|nr:putative transposase-like DNA-binding protein [Kribbella sp. VKM Ac-2527]
MSRFRMYPTSAQQAALLEHCGQRVNPAYTSQTCGVCGHCAPENRESQAVFRCAACGYYVNAAVNIAAGRAVSARRETPVRVSPKREPQLLPPRSGWNPRPSGRGGRQSVLDCPLPPTPFTNSHPVHPTTSLRTPHHPHPARPAPPPNRVAPARAGFPLVHPGVTRDNLVYPRLRRWAWARRLGAHRPRARSPRRRGAVPLVWDTDAAGSARCGRSRAPPGAVRRTACRRGRRTTRSPAPSG